ncbi:MAG: adenylate/guanylate cyclase domain-containing protein [Bacteroidota bacterium]
MSAVNANFDIAYFLNRFYTVLGDPILINNGIIYQYVGDEIIGIFGTVGGTKQKNCTDALRAAIGMQYALALLNKTELKDFEVELQMGIGINFGRAFIGHLGHPTHRQFSVIGDPVPDCPIVPELYILYFIELPMIVDEAAHVNGFTLLTILLPSSLAQQTGMWLASQTLMSIQHWLPTILLAG